MYQLSVISMEEAYVYFFEDFPLFREILQVAEPEAVEVLQAMQPLPRAEFIQWSDKYEVKIEKLADYRYYRLIRSDYGWRLEYYSNRPNGVPVQGIEMIFNNNDTGS